MSDIYLLIYLYFKYLSRKCKKCQLFFFVIPSRNLFLTNFRLIIGDASDIPNGLFFFLDWHGICLFNLLRDIFPESHKYIS